MNKEITISNIENNIFHYKKLLFSLKNSSLKDKEKQISLCEQAINKQEKILQNVKEWSV